MSAAFQAPAANPGRVIRLALLAWGLGDLALGRRPFGLAWLISEVVAAAVVAYLFIGLADTNWYLIPFVAGALFLVAWAVQAALAYRAAIGQLAEGDHPTPRAAAAMAWLTIPLLLWGAGFWLASGSGTSPAAAIDRFETSWVGLVAGSNFDSSLRADPRLASAALAATQALQRLCAQGFLSSDCSTSPRNLVRNVRISVTPDGADAANATVTVVSFERRSSRFLGLFAATELVPVPRQTLLTLHLRATAVAFPGEVQLGAQRWKIADVRTP